MFRFASKTTTMNEMASDASIVHVEDVSSETTWKEEIVEEEVPPPIILAPQEKSSLIARDVKPPTMVAPLETSSLHTTCSDASIHLDTYRATTTTTTTTTTTKAKDSSIILPCGGELSFHVSQLETSSVVLGNGLDRTLRTHGDDDDDDDDDVSELYEDDEEVPEFYDDDSHVPENTRSSSEEVKHDMETLITVSQHLLHSSPPPNQGTTTETKDKGSLFGKYKFLVTLAIVVGVLARIIYFCWQVYTAVSNFFASWAPPMNKLLIREDDIHLMVGDFTYQKKDIDSSSGYYNMGLVQAIAIGIMATLALSTTKQCEEKLDTVVSESVGSFITAELDAMSISVEPSLPISRSAPVQQPDKKKNPPVDDVKWDLSKYEQLTVMELRALLRSRQCTYVGRKVHLIQRLVTVYRAELESMTVVQLRRKLKSKKMKQGGLKRDLVQKLLEAGL